MPPPKRHFTQRHYEHKVTDHNEEYQDQEEDGFSKLLGVNSNKNNNNSSSVNRKPNKTPAGIITTIKSEQSHSHHKAQTKSTDVWILRVRGVPATVTLGNFQAWYLDPVLAELAINTQEASSSKPAVTSVLELITTGSDADIIVEPEFSYRGSQTIFIKATSRAIANKLQDLWDGLYMGGGYWFKVDQIAWTEMDACKRQQYSQRQHHHQKQSSLSASTLQNQQFRSGGIQDLRLIHQVIEKVVKYGPVFEATLMQREYHNPRFEFLFGCRGGGCCDGGGGDGSGYGGGNVTAAAGTATAACSVMHQYYKSKLHSILYTQYYLENSETAEPSFTATSSTDVLVDRRGWEQSRPDQDLHYKDNDNNSYPVASVASACLGSLNRHHLLLLLQHTCTYRRGSIARVLGFALDHAYAASEVVDLICQSIECNSGGASRGSSVSGAGQNDGTEAATAETAVVVGSGTAGAPDSTSVRARVARLYIVSDILYNTQVLSRGRLSKGLMLEAGGGGGRILGGGTNVNTNVNSSTSANDYPRLLQTRLKTKTFKCLDAVFRGLKPGIASMNLKRVIEGLLEVWVGWGIWDVKVDGRWLTGLFDGDDVGSSGGEIQEPGVPASALASASESASMSIQRSTSSSRDNNNDDNNTEDYYESSVTPAAAAGAGPVGGKGRLQLPKQQQQQQLGSTTSNPIVPKVDMEVDGSMVSIEDLEYYKSLIASKSHEVSSI